MRNAAHIAGFGGLLVAALCATAVSTAAAAEPITAYAALGDSYTAGPLIPNTVGAPTGCRSDHNYPSLVAAAIHAVSFRDASCSGADTGNMTSPETLMPQSNPPQFDVLARTDDLVTLQIGTNDTHLAAAVVLCGSAALVLPIGTPCRDQYVTPAGDELAGRIAGAAPALAAVIQDIHARAPHARVLVLGYPAILPESDSACWPGVPITAGDVGYLRAKEQELNAMISAQAAANGAEYVDLYTRSIGHDMCTPTGTRWIENLTPTSSAYAFHPNLLSMQDSAEAVEATLGPTATQAGCPARHVRLPLGLRRGERVVRAAVYLDSRRVHATTAHGRAVLRIPAGPKGTLRARARVRARTRHASRNFTIHRAYRRCIA